MLIEDIVFSGPVFICLLASGCYWGVCLIKSLPTVCLQGSSGCYCNGYMDNEGILAGRVEALVLALWSSQLKP